VTAVEQFGPGGILVQAVGSTRDSATTGRSAMLMLDVPNECETCEQYNPNRPDMGYAPTCELITRDERPCAIDYATAVRLRRPPQDGRCLWRLSG